MSKGANQVPAAFLETLAAQGFVLGPDGSWSRPAANDDAGSPHPPTPAAVLPPIRNEWTDRHRIVRRFVTLSSDPRERIAVLETQHRTMSRGALGSDLHQVRAQIATERLRLREVA
jgi:hypothetical protein